MGLFTSVHQTHSLCLQCISTKKIYSSDKKKPRWKYSFCSFFLSLSSFEICIHFLLFVNFLCNCWLICVFMCALNSTPSCISNINHVLPFSFAFGFFMNINQSVWRKHNKNHISVTTKLISMLQQSNYWTFAKKSLRILLDVSRFHAICSPLMSCQSLHVLFRVCEF